MKKIVTFLLFTLVLHAHKTYAQKLTGIWRGTFEQKDFNPINGGFSSSIYRYEVQINELENKALQGVTYSYLDTRFYGKASLSGLHKKTTSLIIKELKMLELKAAGQTEPCLMTCYLEYKKDGEVEVLTGTYTSVNANSKADCGSGTVYLERVENSKFKKEAFLLQRKDFALPKTDKSTAKNNTSTKVLPNAGGVKPGAEKFVIAKNKPLKRDSTKQSITKLEPKKTPPASVYPEPKLGKKDTEVKVPVEEAIDNYPQDVPEVLLKRNNRLATEITVDAPEVLLEFYDNGEIDGDYISVYKEHECVIDNKMLSLSPLKIKLKFTDKNNSVSIYTVAETLGKIPPNTAFLVVTYGNERKEILLNSDNKNNAKIIINYNAAKRVK